jgi:hypothetical membrane protein
MTPAKVGACLWLLCLQFFIAEQVARMGWTGHYSMRRDYISDLGANASSLHWVMNGSFVLQGLLIFFGAVLLRGLLPRIAVALLAIAGLGVLVVGLVPEDTNARLHLLGAAANFLGGNLAIILLAKHWKSWITFAAGSIGLLAAFALAFRGMSWDAGTVERLAAYPLPLFLSWSGWRMLRDHLPQGLLKSLREN